jgi:ketosteroid isomerase-like protein
MTTEPVAAEVSAQEVLQKLNTALNGRDREAAKEAFAADGVFYPSTGADGFHGPDECVRGLFNFLEKHRSGRFEAIRRVFAGDEVYTEWRFKGEALDGTAVDLHGCDYFLVRDGEILIKSSFRKVP